jgi:hypothetical protein
LHGSLKRTQTAAGLSKKTPDLSEVLISMPFLVGSGALSGYSPEAWLLAWKHDELDDSRENMELMIEASALRAALAGGRGRGARLAAGKST